MPHTNGILKKTQFAPATALGLRAASPSARRRTDRFAYKGRPAARPAAPQKAAPPPPDKKSPAPAPESPKPSEPPKEPGK